MVTKGDGRPRAPHLHPSLDAIVDVDLRHVRFGKLLFQHTNDPRHNVRHGLHTLARTVHEGPKSTNAMGVARFYTGFGFDACCAPSAPEGCGNRIANHSFFGTILKKGGADIL